jgi:hypothetical protein
LTLKENLSSGGPLDFSHRSHRPHPKNISSWPRPTIEKEKPAGAGRQISNLRRATERLARLRESREAKACAAFALCAMAVTRCERFSVSVSQHSLCSSAGTTLLTPHSRTLGSVYRRADGDQKGVGHMADKEPYKRIEALKPKKKQTATMKRRALKPKSTKQSMVAASSAQTA